MKKWDGDKIMPIFKEEFSMSKVVAMNYVKSRKVMIHILRVWKN